MQSERGRFRLPPEKRCRLIREYEAQDPLGAGTYGEVRRCKLRTPPAQHSDGRMTEPSFALKKVLIPSHQKAHGFPPTALREIQVLRRCQHDNVVRLLEVVVDEQGFVPKDDADKPDDFAYLVFDLAKTDLRHVLNHHRSRSTPVPLSDMVSYSRDLFCGLHHIHTKGILHRDIKPANLLVCEDGTLKIADFGSARQFDPADADGRLTPRICSRWYRAPEILLGLGHYDGAVDIWSAGCILAEMATLVPVLKGEGETDDVADIDQLDCIFKLRGTPRESDWPALESTAIKFQRHQRRSLRDQLKPMLPARPQLPDAFYDVLQGILEVIPSRRLKPKDVLSKPWFWGPHVSSLKRSRMEAKGRPSHGSRDQRYHPYK